LRKKQRSPSFPPNNPETILNPIDKKVKVFIEKETFLSLRAFFAEREMNLVSKPEPGVDEVFARLASEALSGRTCGKND
jgi:hypothetical protein